MNPFGVSTKFFCKIKTPKHNGAYKTTTNFTWSTILFHFQQVPNRLLESQAIEPTHFLVMAGQSTYLPPRISNSPVLLDPLIFG
jgi:hypothetical protein